MTAEEIATGAGLTGAVLGVLAVILMCVTLDSHQNRVSHFLTWACLWGATTSFLVCIWVGVTV